MLKSFVKKTTIEMVLSKVVLFGFAVYSSVAVSNYKADDGNPFILEIEKFQNSPELEKLDILTDMYHEKPELFHEIIQNKSLINSELLNEVEKATLSHDGARCRC